VDPFVAEIRIFAGNFAPVGWALCDGQLLPISQNTALFSLLGTNYGGNGTSNFALPNLQGSSPLGYGQGAGLTQRILGETGGEQTVTLNQNELPAHSHIVQGTTGTAAASPANATFGTGARGRPPAYGNPTTPVVQPTVEMNPAMTAATGGNQAHDNMPPYLALTFIIALQGVYPARS
jgi:microcystin-dependent protein